MKHAVRWLLVNSIIYIIHEGLGLHTSTLFSFAIFYVSTTFILFQSGSMMVTILVIIIFPVN